MEGWASCPKQASCSGSSLSALALLHTHGSPRCQRCHRVEAQSTLPGLLALDPGGCGGPLCPSHPRALLLCVVSRIHLLPPHPCSGPQGPPKAPRGVNWIVHFVVLGDQEDAASRLSGGASSWHPESLFPAHPLPCFPGTALWRRDATPWMHPGWSPLCPAALPVHHLLLLPCWSANPFFRVTADALLVGISLVASVTSCPLKSLFLSLCPGWKWRVCSFLPLQA